MKFIIYLACCFGPILLQAAGLNGDAELEAKVFGETLKIKTTNRLAGAIGSFVYKGVEYIDQADHGRELQSAINADWQGQIFGECFNPTEAGTVADGAGPKSSSVLEQISVRDGVLSTRNQMAFWLAPNMSSHGHSAFNQTVLSNHRITKRVSVGHKNFENVLDYKVTYTVPADEVHYKIAIESLTGYMPGKFSVGYTYNAKTKTFDLVEKAPNAEIRKPVVLATSDGTSAMGVFTPDKPAAGCPPVGYGYWSFEKAKATKWNCVFRLYQKEPIKAGDYTYQHYVVFGSLEQCRLAMVGLHEEFFPEK
jgi:hypothetical protein